MIICLYPVKAGRWGQRQLLLVQLQRHTQFLSKTHFTQSWALGVPAAVLVVVPPSPYLQKKGNTVEVPVQDSRNR